MNREFSYQSVLIALGVVASLFLGVFFYREIFPEYREYQDRFVKLEAFRSTLTHEPPAPFKEGVKQLVIEREDKGPASIDRCTSCHVAMQIEAYSPTRLQHDINGNLVYDAHGFPVKEENPDYIWKKLDEKIALEKNSSAAAEWGALKKVRVGDAEYDVEKVLTMHPLIGRETRPFQYHPIEEWGCTSCHGGNGRGLVTDRAHGPVMDGQYEEEQEGFVPQFLESDPEHDPAFSKVFNHKPSHRLLFQTNPIYVGALIQAKCVQCHQSSSQALLGANDSAAQVINTKEKEIKAIAKAYQDELEAVYSGLTTKKLLKEKGLEGAIKALKANENNYLLSDREREYSSVIAKRLSAEKGAELIDASLLSALGSSQEIDRLSDVKSLDALNQAISKDAQDQKGTLFEKYLSLKLNQALIAHLKEVGASSTALKESQTVGSIETDVDLLTKNYHHGEELFLSQGCYACHRIAGRSRGGVGPELTRSGESYPWFVKQSIVWPQADLKTSTMPNFRLDHEELEDLVTYLLGQTGKRKAVSETAQRLAIQEWEAGKKLAWELPVGEKEIHDLRYSMKVFASEGCASCHRLRGYESNVQFAEGVPVAEQKAWFGKFFPEDITGSMLVKTLEKQGDEIQRRLVVGSKKETILEEIEKEHPGLISSFYAPFKFAARAKEDPQWKRQVHLVLMQYVQTYGLGRLICPRPNWSGVYRSDQWLMEHFKSPSSMVPRSIMPVFPFDTSKFKALTLMLDQLGVRNATYDRTVERAGGFNPESAYTAYCAQCHGETRQGNGPVSTWIYPIPKNLRNAEFMRNLTRERAKQSIIHGVKGTPMPPWGEVGDGKKVDPVLTESEVDLLVDWLYATLPGSTIITNDKEVPKWNYMPDQVQKELNAEGIFDERPMKGTGPEKEGYFIKSKFYTPENIDAGKTFFWTNCAPCHGKEADGAGLRAEAMQDAKPRMLTNLEWLNSRDDLRLLRSIKYGVAGTSMTPWGDQTNPLQRLQLVVFIRSLSAENERRAALRDALYEAFDSKGTEKDLALKLWFQQIGQGFINLSDSEEGSQLLLARIAIQDQPLKWKESDQKLLEYVNGRLKNLDEEMTVEESKIESTEKRIAVNRIQAEIASWNKQKALIQANLNKAEKQ